MSKKLKWYSFRWRAFLLVLLLISSGVGYFLYRVHLVTRVLPMGSGPAGPAIGRQVFLESWYDGRVVLLGIGDSITRGFGASKKQQFFTLLHNNDDSLYPDMAGLDLSTVLNNLEINNIAQDYTVTQQHIDRQLPRIPVYGSDVKGIVIITSGGNDLIHDYGRSEAEDGAIYGCTYKQGVEWTENIKGRIGQILEGVTAKFPGGCEIFLANIYDPTDGVSDPQIAKLPRWPDAVRVLGLMNQKISELCDSYDNVHLVDIHSEFLGHGFHCTERWRRHYKKNGPHHWYDPNIEDPNLRGHDAIRRLYMAKMIEVLPGKLSQVIGLER